MFDIDYIMELIDWNNSIENQMRGIRLAQNIKCINAFLQPGTPYGKNVWDNCAKILYIKTDIELESYIIKLLEWIQDFNWPGALTILARLKSFSGEQLIRPFMKFFNYAVSLQNEEGLMWLDNLSELLDNQELKKQLPDEALETLQKHYHNWAWWYNE